MQDTLELPSRARDHEVVIGWRIDRLSAAGYDGESALVIALDPEIDLHAAVSLLEHGCPIDLALQILF